MKKRYVVCDSGSLISLTSTCMLELLYFFNKKFNVNFVIPPGVEEEAVLYPMRRKIKKYLYSAIRIKDAINDGIVEVMELDDKEKRDKILYVANNIFYARGKPIRLIHLGETEMIVLANEIGCESLLLDERTTRMLIEAPFVLKKHMEDEFGVNLMLNKEHLKEISDYTLNMNAFRSSELVMLAYENGFFKGFEKMEKDAMEAALYNVKFAGCSLRFDEITKYLRWVK